MNMYIEAIETFVKDHHLDPVDDTMVEELAEHLGIPRASLIIAYPANGTLVAITTGIDIETYLIVDDRVMGRR